MDLPAVVGKVHFAKVDERSLIDAAAASVPLAVVYECAALVGKVILCVRFAAIDYYGWALTHIQIVYLAHQPSVIHQHSTAKAQYGILGLILIPQRRYGYALAYHYGLIGVTVFVAEGKVAVNNDSCGDYIIDSTEVFFLIGNMHSIFKELFLIEDEMIYVFIAKV